MTIQKFRTFDLIILTVIAVILDIVVGLFGFFSIQLFMAISFPIIMLCYIRWHVYGIIPNVIISIAHLLIHNDPEISFMIVLIHAFSVLAWSLTLLMIKYKPFKKKKLTYGNASLMFLIIYIVMITIEWILLSLFNQPITYLNQLLNHTLNLIVGLGLTVIIAYQKDLMVDMKIYLMEKEKGN